MYISLSDLPDTPTKGNTSSRADGSISPPRTYPPKPLPRVTIKQKNALYEDDVEEFVRDESRNDERKGFSEKTRKPQVEIDESNRTSLSGIDPKRLEHRMKMKMKRPSSAPMKKQSGKENVKPEGVDLRKYWMPW